MLTLILFSKCEKSFFSRDSSQLLLPHVCSYFTKLSWTCIRTVPFLLHIYNIYIYIIYIYIYILYIYIIYIYVYIYIYLCVCVCVCLCVRACVCVCVCVFVWVLPLLDVIHCSKLSLYTISRKTNDWFIKKMRKWQKNYFWDRFWFICPKFGPPIFF